MSQSVLALKIINSLKKKPKCTQTLSTSKQLSHHTAKELFWLHADTLLASPNGDGPPGNLTDWNRQKKNSFSNK